MFYLFYRRLLRLTTSSVYVSPSHVIRRGVAKLNITKLKRSTPINWKYWNPGLDNNDQSLKEVYQTLPRYEFISYPLIVLIVENPKSPIAIKGKCSLLRHDLIHVLLGRGLFVQDEAFVIGYTMGTSKQIGGFEKELFKFCAHRFYPKKYRFSKEDLAVYDIGFMAGQANKIDIFDIELEKMMDDSLGEVRKRLNIDMPLLRYLYSLEQQMIHTKASQRIPAYYNIASFGG